ncbi:MAG: hypothetical protein AVDCRST_MAG39-11, partial [uncultured Sphingomonadaceae bacterium]
ASFRPDRAARPAGRSRPRRRAASGRRARHVRRAGRAVSARHHRGAAEPLPGARAAGAEHPRLPPALHAGDDGAPGAARQVSGDRLPRPPGRDRHARGAGEAGGVDGQPEPRHDGGREQHERRGAQAHHGGDPRLAGGTRARARPHRDRLPQRRAGVGGEGHRAAGGRRRRGRRGRGRDRQGARALDQEGRRLATEDRRSGARPGVGGVRAAQAPGVHPHRRPAGVLAADRQLERAVARAGAVPRPALPGGAVPELRAADDGARRDAAAQPEDDVRHRAHGLARQRPAAAGEAHDRAAQRAHRDRRGALRHRAAAARGARLLRALPGPHPVRQGLVPARGVPVLLAGLRDARRLLRLLPPVPRVLEAVRHRPAGPGAAQAVLRERAADHAGATASAERGAL